MSYKTNARHFTGRSARRQAVQGSLLCQFALSLSAWGGFNMPLLMFGFYNRIISRRCSVRQINGRGPLCNSYCGRKNGMQPERTHNEVSYSVGLKASSATGSARAKFTPRMLLVSLSPVTAFNVTFLLNLFNTCSNCFFSSPRHASQRKKHGIHCRCNFCLWNWRPYKPNAFFHIVRSAMMITVHFIFWHAVRVNKTHGFRFG